MRKQRYTVERVYFAVNVTSQIDYMVKVRIADATTKRLQIRTYCINEMAFSTRAGWEDRPRYLVEAVLAELQRKLDQLFLYEYDADGNRRNDNLRYGRRAELVSLVMDRRRLPPKSEDES
jgi:hypothetical protein